MSYTFRTTEAVVEALVEGLGEQIEVEARTDYSGRGMYGDRCLGLITEESDWSLAVTVMSLREIVAMDGEDEDLLALIEALVENNPSSDSMGRGAIIVYWPSITVEDAGEEDFA